MSCSVNTLFTSSAFISFSHFSFSQHFNMIFILFGYSTWLLAQLCFLIGWIFFINAETTSILKLLLHCIRNFPYINIVFIFDDQVSKMALMEGQSIKLFGINNLKWLFSKTNCQIVEFLALMWFLRIFWKVKMKYMLMQNILKTFPIYKSKL